MRGSKHVTLLAAAGSILALAALVSIIGCDNQTATQSGDVKAPPTKEQPTPKPMEQTEMKSTEQPAAAPSSKPAAPLVVMETSLGTIVLELDADKTPVTVANFLKYVDDRFYDGLIFHRVIRGFMNQGGGFDTNSVQKQPSYPPIVNESSTAASNTRGTIAMARTNVVNSATSQFFINTANNTQLDYSAGHGGYCVFGRVVEGMDVVDKIAGVPVQRSRVSEAQPLENIVIISARRK